MIEFIFKSRPVFGQKKLLITMLSTFAQMSLLRRLVMRIARYVGIISILYLLIYADKTATTIQTLRTVL